MTFVFHSFSANFSMNFYFFFIAWIVFCANPVVMSLRNEYTIPEDVAVGHVIVNLAQEFSIDPHSRSQSLQLTNSQSSDGSRHFTINASTGELCVSASLDRERLCEGEENCVLELMIAHGDRRNPEVTQIQVRILDANDNSPTFPQKLFELKIREGMDPRLIVKTMPAAYDPDLGRNSVSKYMLAGRPEEILPFGVDQKDNVPQLILHQKLDRERKSVYNFRLLARDGGRPQRTGTLSVRVIVEDVNDHQPVFERKSYSTIINENTPEGVTILELKATDKDAGKNGLVAYRMAHSQSREEILARQYFDVFSSDGIGKIIIKKTVDIDKRQRLYYKFHVIAFDQGLASLETDTLVTVRVRDVNDDKPNIKINYLKPDGIMKTRGLLTENQEKIFVALITVTDRDSGSGGLVSCKVDSDLFYLQDIERSSGNYKPTKWQTKKYKLLTRQGVDREKNPQLSFTLTCHDNAIAQKSVGRLVSTARIDLRIEDQNDERPEFTEERYTFHLVENVGKRNVEVQVGQVKAVDRDEGPNAKISYHLINDANNGFRIERRSGMIYALRDFDREHMDKVILKVKAVDGGEHRQSSTAEVKVIITDVNDNAPIFKATDYHFTVVENSRTASVGKVEALDEDRGMNSQIEYRIVDRHSTAKSFFSINRHTGAIHLTNRLDREKHEQYTFFVVAVDKPNPGQSRNTGTTTVTVTVLDENDNKPVISSPANNAIMIIDDNEPIGKDLFTMKATDPDDGSNGTVSYHVIRGADDFFSIDKGSGLFFVMRKLEGLHNKLFSVVLMAKDNGREISLNSSITVRIRVRSGNQGHIPPTDHEQYDSGDTGRTLIVVAAIVLLLLVLAAVALLVMLRMRRVPNSDRRNNEDIKRKWKGGFVGKMSETYVCSRTGPKGTLPKGGVHGDVDEKVDEYLLESPALRAKDLEANYNSLNFYKGDPSPDKIQPDHTYYEVAKSKDGSIDNYASYEKDDMSHENDLTLHKKSPFLGDMRMPGLNDPEMTMVSTKRRQEKPLTPYIEASFV